MSMKYASYPDSGNVYVWLVHPHCLFFNDDDAPDHGSFHDQAYRHELPGR